MRLRGVCCLAITTLPRPTLHHNSHIFYCPRRDARSAAAALSPRCCCSSFTFTDLLLFPFLFALHSSLPRVGSTTHRISGALYSTVCPSVLSLSHPRVDSGEANQSCFVCFLNRRVFLFRLVFVSTKYFNYFGIKISESRLTRK